MNISWILQASVLMGAALLVGAALGRRSSAAQRHGLYLAAVLTVLALPVLYRLGAPVPLGVAAVSVPVFTVTANTASPVDWASILQQIWLSGVVLVALGYLIGAARAVWLCRTSRAFRDSARLHPSVRVPMAVGWLRPQILLPEGAAAWPAERISTAIAHERAHISRLDCLWTLAAGCACAMYWFHPLVWMLVGRLRHDAERASDDTVLRLGVDARDYASHLIEAAREAGNRWEPAAGIAMANAPKLESRVVAVLDSTTRRMPLGRWAGATTATVAAVLTLMVSGTVTSHAQDAAPGRLGIFVTDASGARVPQAIVALQDGPKRIQAMRTTADDGYVRFDSLPGGDYRVEVQAKGFKATAKSVRLEAGNGAQVAIPLEVGLIFESVKVSAGEPRPATASGPTRIRVGGNVQAGKLKNQVPVSYPQDAKNQRIEGSVFLQAVILMDGSIGGLEVVSSPHPVLSAAAMDAVRQWTYEPTLLNGQPVEVITKIAINFTLSD